MRKLIIILMLFITGCASSGGGGAKTYEFYNLKDGKGDPLVANTYYEVLAVYYYMVHKVRISHELPGADVENIIYTILRSLEKGEAIQLQIPRYRSRNTLRVTLRTDVELKKHKQPNLLIASNYDLDKKRPLPDGANLDNTYANLFFMVGDKLVRYPYIMEPSSKEDLAKLTPVQLSNQYLYDDSFDNDEVGFKMLDKELAKEKDPLTRVYLLTTKAEYQLMYGNYEDARATLEEAEKIVNAQRSGETKDKMSYTWTISKNIYVLCKHYDERR